MAAEITLDSEIAAVLERMAAEGGPSLPDQPLADARAAHDAIAVWASGPGQEVARVEDCTIAAPDGPVPVRIYWPAGAEPPGGAGTPREADPHGSTEPSRTVDAGEVLGAIAYFHGGGWVMGSIDSFDCVCRALTNAAGAVLVSVGYRLAPEHPFPAGVRDAGAALEWVAHHAAELGADPARLAVVGDSAGANLGTVAVRNAPDVDVAFQALVYPVADGHSSDEDEGMRWMWESYGAGADDPDAAPVRADLAGLPPTLILLAEGDPLRPDGEAYAEALRAAGVEVECCVVEGTVHGFWRWQALCGVARRTVDDVGEAIRGGL